MFGYEGNTSWAECSLIFNSLVAWEIKELFSLLDPAFGGRNIRLSPQTMKGTDRPAPHQRAHQPRLDAGSWRFNCVYAEMSQTEVLHLRIRWPPNSGHKGWTYSLRIRVEDLQTCLAADCSEVCEETSNSQWRYELIKLFHNDFMISVTRFRQIDRLVLYIINRFKVNVDHTGFPL